MKTTLEIPDVLFRRAKAAAAEQGIPFRELVTGALAEKLKTLRNDKPLGWRVLASCAACGRKQPGSTS